MSKDYSNLVMVTKLGCGDEFISLVLPISEQQFLIAYPMRFNKTDILEPWFDYTANRVFNIQPNDIIFCKSPNDALISDYLSEIVMCYDDAVVFMNSLIEQEETQNAEADTRVLH